MELEKILLDINKNKKETYLEEKNIVFGTIVNKQKNSKQAVAQRITIGYILPNNNIYDFVTKNIYKIYNEYILEQDGEVFLLSHRIFKTTNRRIRLKSYDHKLLDFSAAKIVETAKKAGSQVSGPVPLPTEKQIVTILRAVHKYKDSREQFEIRTHKRLIDIANPTPKTVDSIMRLDLPAGVDITVKIM